ncbi:triphosphoribosyl-dephospho-CoA synthase [Caldimonas tepidiphila]|uniref:triphosphoribosyl-dephospho-CoA synthase n=1 Tax=Caldimonas tepidiphila TaxID=2315841 RepID=UPI000E5BB01A|nr:triphosphoribosyl-dephospho-CoA synthase [Caldimonas tepidiphila]
MSALLRPGPLETAAWQGPGRDAFLLACELDVAVRKPGNVSGHSEGHRMDAAMFLRSAAAAAPALFARGRPVGERIESAMRATVAAAGCNTNLGIVLLCAPIAAALERRPAPGDAAALRRAVEQVLDGLDVDDARAAYRAIALANPGGLGRAAEQDVAEAPSLALREAMALAAHRDSIARQYALGFEDLFDTGLAAFRAAAPRGVAAAVQAAWLAFAARWPDSHIVRKHGEPAAHSVMAQAQVWRQRALRGAALDADPCFAVWDESLKAQGLNPGTSADLAVATLLLATLLEPGWDHRVSRAWLWHGT